jgi:hypothetical protein
MIPKKNKKKFVEEYGNWWYLREFDFRVENLADYEYPISIEMMRIICERKECDWMVYNNYNDAVRASKYVRSSFGLPEINYPPEDCRTYKFLTEMNGK